MKIRKELGSWASVEELWERFKGAKGGKRSMWNH